MVESVTYFFENYVWYTVHIFYDYVETILNFIQNNTILLSLYMVINALWCIYIVYDTILAIRSDTAESIFARSIRDNRHNRLVAESEDRYYKHKNESISEAEERYHRRQEEYRKNRETEHQYYMSLKSPQFADFFCENKVSMEKEKNWQGFLLAKYLGYEGTYNENMNYPELIEAHKKYRDMRINIENDDM